MFDIGWGELVVIGIVALIAIGPKELPTVLRTLGQYMGKIKRMSAEFQGQFQEALREADVADLKKQAEDLSSSVTDFTNFDPLADSEKATDRAAEGAGEPATAAASVEPADTVLALTETSEAATPPPIDVPPPEMPDPVTSEDFASTEAPSTEAKPAEGSA
jgi:sec-independent protein translocase protein TatB